MCGRVIQSSGPLRLAIVEGLDVSENRLGNVPRRYNAAPSQELLVIRENHETGERSLDLIKWGLIPHWCQDPKGGRKPINAKAESVSRLPMFRMLTLSGAASCRSMASSSGERSRAHGPNNPTQLP
jgi:putative SOS response-associated peptidase YedK